MIGPQSTRISMLLEKGGIGQTSVVHTPSTLQRTSCTLCDIVYYTSRAIEHHPLKTRPYEEESTTLLSIDN